MVLRLSYAQKGFSSKTSTALLVCLFLLFIEVSVHANPIFPTVGGRVIRTCGGAFRESLPSQDVILTERAQPADVQVNAMTRSVNESRVRLNLAPFTDIVNASAEPQAALQAFNLLSHYASYDRLLSISSQVESDRTLVRLGGGSLSDALAYLQRRMARVDVLRIADIPGTTKMTVVADMATLDVLAANPDLLQTLAFSDIELLFLPGFENGLGPLGRNNRDEFRNAFQQIVRALSEGRDPFEAEKHQFASRALELGFSRVRFAEAPSPVTSIAEIAPRFHTPDRPVPAINMNDPVAALAVQVTRHMGRLASVEEVKGLMRGHYTQIQSRFGNNFMLWVPPNFDTHASRDVIKSFSLLTYLYARVNGISSSRIVTDISAARSQQVILLDDIAATGRQMLVRRGFVTESQQQQIVFAPLYYTAGARTQIEQQAGTNRFMGGVEIPTVSDFATSSMLEPFTAVEPRIRYRMLGYSPLYSQFSSYGRADESTFGSSMTAIGFDWQNPDSNFDFFRNTVLDR